MSAFTESRVGSATKDAGMAALVTFALAVVLVGLRTRTETGGLTLTGQWSLVAWMVAVVFVGRLFISMFIWRGKNAFSDAAKAVSPKADTLTKIGKFVGPALLAFAVFLPLTGDRYLIDMGILVLTYIMLGWGLNIVVGLAGLLDLGYVAFYAVGAYSYALFAQYFDLSFWVCLPIAGILASFWGIILGFPVLRLRGDYLAIVTLAFGEIIRVILLNWYEFTGGPDGISRIPRPSFFGLEFTRGEGGFADFFGLEYSSLHRVVFLFYVILVLALITNFVTMRLRKLPIGPGLGSPARGRNRLPLPWHQHHQHQADGFLAWRDVRRVCRRLLRHPSGFHLPGELHLHGIGHHSGHCGSGGPWQPAWRRRRVDRDDRRLRSLPRSGRAAHAGLRPAHWWSS